MLFDLTSTAILSGGDSNLEGNKLAIFLWDNLGVLRHLDYVVWPIYIYGITFFFNLFNRYLALWWVYGIGIAHLLGGLSWYTFTVHNFLYDSLYAIFNASWVFYTPITLLGLFFGLIITVFHYFMHMYKNK